MILSFGDKATERLYHGGRSKEARRFPADIIAAALRKLDMLNAVQEMKDLRSPPGNRLEALKGNWKGFHSIRVSDQWRIVFRWEARNAHQVSLTDYH